MQNIVARAIDPLRELLKWLKKLEKKLQFLITGIDKDDGYWHEVEDRGTFQDKNGNRLSGLRMRRRLPDGSYEFRPMTPEEEFEFVSYWVHK